MVLAMQIAYAISSFNLLIINVQPNVFSLFEAMNKLQTPGG